MGPRSLVLGTLACALLAAQACSLNFAKFKPAPAKQGGDAGKARDAGAAHDGSGSLARDASRPNDDGGVQPGADSATPNLAQLCTPLATRCAQTRVEACAAQGDAWKLQTECAAKSCNPVSVACNACSAPVAADGVLSCASARASATGDAIASTDTKPARDTDHGSCGGLGSPERVIEWIAPETDYWVLDTRGSNYDTVLYARDCSCSGAELGCNDNADSSTSASDLVAHFERGQRVALFVDGNAGDKGTAVLNAHPVTCPTIDLDPAALPTTFMDKGKDGTESFRFTPKSTAFYSIRVHAKSGSKVCMKQGARCGGATIACNTGTGSYGAQVIRELMAGQPITVEVTLMGDTSFELDIKPVAGAVCTTDDLFNNLGTTLTFNSTQNYLTGSCAPAGSSLYSMPAFNELRYAVHSTLRAPSEYVIDVTSDFPAAVYLLHNDCGGEELQCAVSTYDATMQKYSTGAGITGAPTDQDYVLVIENINQNAGVPQNGFEIQVRLL